jgi:hypothetical protein
MTGDMGITAGHGVPVHREAMTGEPRHAEIAVLQSDLSDVRQEVTRYRRALWLVNTVCLLGFGYMTWELGWHWVIGASLAPVIGNVGAWLRLADRRKVIEELNRQIEAAQPVAFSPAPGSPTPSTGTDT